MSSKRKWTLFFPKTGKYFSREFISERTDDIHQAAFFDSLMYANMGATYLDEDVKVVEVTVRITTIHDERKEKIDSILN
jgi:hypothetical protein